MTSPEPAPSDPRAKPHPQRHHDAARIRVLATTDLHMHLLSFDYYSDQPEPSVGLTRVATLIRAARAESEAMGALTVLVDNGDSLQGTPLGDWSAGQSASRHPLMQAFDRLGYDAIGLGNHDFNFGLDTLTRILKQAPCPVLCSNMRRLDGATPWQSTAVLERRLTLGGRILPIRMGILSVLPPQTIDWESHLLKGRAEVRDILDTAADTAQRLRNEGCDLVIALAHTGLGGQAARPHMENAAIPLAAIPEIDACIAGHTHILFPDTAGVASGPVDPTRGVVHGKPVVQPGSAGSHLGVIDLDLARDADGRWRVVEHHCELRPIFARGRMGEARPLVDEDAELARLFATDHARTQAQITKPVGTVAQPLHSYFSFCAPDRGLALVAAAQAAALRPYLAGRVESDLPLLSATAPAKFGGRAGPRHYTDVPAGPISLRHVSDLHVFPNELRCAIITGRQLRDWLEMSASLFNQIPPGSADTALVDPGHPGHNFDVLHGVRYVIDPSVPARFRQDGSLIDPAHARIRDLCRDGAPVTDTQRFVVAMNNFRASGGGNFRALTGAEPIPIPPIRIQDILRDHLSGRLPADPQLNAPAPWTLAPMPGTAVVLRTGPGAVDHLDEIAPYHPEQLGIGPDGFLRLRLHL